MPGIRDYLRDDLVATVAEEQDHFQALAGSGGIGYIPYLLLVAGLGAIVFGLLHARWSAHAAPRAGSRGAPSSRSASCSCCSSGRAAATSRAWTAPTR